MYLIFGFALFAYAFHRSEPQTFLVKEEGSALFLQHLECTIFAFSAQQTAGIVANSEFTKSFDIFRKLFALGVFGWSLTLLKSGLNSTIRPRRRIRRPMLLITANGKSCPNTEAESLVISVVSRYFKIAESAIKPTTDLVQDLHANRMDIEEIYLLLEQNFEKTVSREAFHANRTISALVVLFAETSAPPRPQLDSTLKDGKTASPRQRKRSKTIK